MERSQGMESMVTEFKMVRGNKANARCKIMSESGYSPLYCDCGCQEPQIEDLDYDLTDVTVECWPAEKLVFSSENPCKLIRNGQQVGSIAVYVTDGKGTISGTVYLDGNEYIEIQAESPLYQLLLDGRRLIKSAPEAEPKPASAGSTLAETAATEAMLEKISKAEANERFKNSDGWCPRCQSFCYGDCEAN
jgi:hypothetical protein